MNFKPNGLATGIGSFPHRTASAACEVILENLPEIPFWPQLSTMDFREQMEIQYSEGIPCVVLDEAKQRMYFDTSGDPTGALEKFYENVLSENLEYFRISPAFSRGIWEMERQLAKNDHLSIKYFKNQVTGPLTFGLATVDENKRAIYYNDVFRDVVIKAITMKARWLVNKFKTFGFSQICFVDEPILSAFGSSTYVSVQREDAVSSIKEVVEAVQAAGAIVGTHCCGNTEWPILIDAGVNIISFDAYEFGDTVRYYPEQIKKFLEAGGALAWGIVPTSEKILKETPDSLIKKLEERVENLAAKGIDRGLIWEQCLLTPSCGTGSLAVELSEKIFRYLSEISRRLKKRAE
jgi:methionine synthase II (cobalamin-independent)